MKTRSETVKLLEEKLRGNPLDIGTSNKFLDLRPKHKQQKGEIKQVTMSNEKAITQQRKPSTSQNNHWMGKYLLTIYQIRD